MQFLNILDISPQACYAQLEADQNAKIIDVRTKEELHFVGIPVFSYNKNNFHHIELLRLPDMSLNTDFSRMLQEAVKDFTCKLFFLCRSGHRSERAAMIAKDIGFTDVYNISNGFEGDLDITNQRGKLNGWKAKGLPWKQS